MWSRCNFTGNLMAEDERLLGSGELVWRKNVEDTRYLIRYSWRDLDLSQLVA
jgi:hypothetical protein